MIGPMYFCATCAAEYPGPAELAEHMRAVHEPEASESELERARRLRVSAHLADNIPDEAGIVSDEPVTEDRHIDGMLLALRRRAAVHVAQRDAAKLLEDVSGLEGIVRLAGVLAGQALRLEAAARKDAGTLRRVVEILEED